MEGGGYSTMWSYKQYVYTVQCACKQYSMSWVQIPPEQIFFLWEKSSSGLLSCLVLMSLTGVHVYINIILHAIFT